MIPWRLQFTGIRDYRTEEMNFENVDDHIIITGPNGSGKSTISFCMGAVLRSNKVFIEGLKSQNLPEDKTWQAAIQFLFKNEGPSRVDGPLFIEFRLRCEQVPKQPIKLRYEIWSGDTIEELELRQIYRSGDSKGNNFTAYQDQLQSVYKIHPDTYYLIWYQSEVSQFAVMAPEERFRIFSEMHGIDKIQKDWETSLEVEKEARESFAFATSQQKSYEFNLSHARNKKNQFEDNQQRLQDNGFEYARMTHLLYLHAEKLSKEMAEFIEARVFELEEYTERQMELRSKLELEKNGEQDLNIEKEQKRNMLEDLSEKRKENVEELSIVDSKVKELEIELSELTEAYDKLLYSEVETRELLIQATKQLEQLNEQGDEIKQKQEKTIAQINESTQKQSDLKAAIKHWDNQMKNIQPLLNRYTSSHQLSQDIDELQLNLSILRENLDKTNRELTEYNAELEQLEGNQIESLRQREAIDYLKTQSISAFPLRKFIQMNNQLPIDKEALFDAIKYTIFYDATTCVPLNNLYHVSLRKIIPDRSITSLPSLGLERCDGLTDEEQNQATRILWWVEQFFVDKKMPRITEEGVLEDERGVRGKEEQNAFILSKRALLERKEFVQNKVRSLSEEVATFEKRIREQNEKFQVWNADVQKVKEAEAFLSKKAEQDYRNNQLIKLNEASKQLSRDIDELNKEEKQVWKAAHKSGSLKEGYKADLLVYEQFGKQAEQIESLQELKKTFKSKKQDSSNLSQQMDVTQDKLDVIDRTLREKIRNIGDVEDAIIKNDRAIDSVGNQKEEKESERIVTNREAIQFKEELDHLKHIIEPLVEKAIAEEQTDLNKYELQNKQTQAKVAFEMACNEKDIDPNAVENFRTLEEEVLRKKDELETAKSLLEENEQRAIQNEQRLETAINMQVQRISLLFEQYMGMFYFEGKIHFEKFIDKKERPVFKLFIYVRKEGHRGKLEDVSFKARGGKVGKGVSGGEESLSSLLFALSLLQNLENKSSFIVMDEFDSALDESRKAKVFELYANELQRKMIILTPKSQENAYYDKFSKAFVVSHNAEELSTKVQGIHMIKAE